VCHIPVAEHGASGHNSYNCRHGLGSAPGMCRVICVTIVLLVGVVRLLCAIVYFWILHRLL